MKQFNINHDLYIRITDEGWKHLKETVGDSYIEHHIRPCKVEINGEDWYRLQCYDAFELLPITFGRKVPFQTVVMIDDKDLTDYVV